MSVKENNLLKQVLFKTEQNKTRHKTKPSQIKKQREGMDMHLEDNMHANIPAELQDILVSLLRMTRP